MDYSYDYCDGIVTSMMIQFLPVIITLSAISMLAPPTMSALTTSNLPAKAAMLSGVCPALSHVTENSFILNEKNEISAIIRHELHL